MIEYVLAALLIVTNAYWAYVCFRLVNRLMSRNFYEFRAAEKRPEKPQVKKPELERDEYAEAQAAQLNSIIHIG